MFQYCQYPKEINLKLHKCNSSKSYAFTFQKSLTYKLPDFSLMLNHTTRFFWFSSGYGSQTDRPTISNQKVATFLRGRRRLRRQRLCTSVLTPPTPLWTLWELKIYEVATLIPLTDAAQQLSDSRAELVVLGTSQSRAEI